MESTFDLPDSTDWLDTPLTLVAPLESSLRCQVCKDFFDNPVITSCSHTFCSLCIRRCLSTEGKCPTCRSSDQELKLRRNWAVQELVEAFKNARPSVLELARRATKSGGTTVDEDGDAERPLAKKRKLEEEVNGSESGGGEGVRTRSQSRGAMRQVLPTPIEIVDDVQDDEYIPDDGLVACPVCQRRMKHEAVFRHLDTCTGEGGGRAEPKPAAFGSLSSATRRPLQDVGEKPPERLPVINYSILKDTVLRKKLKDLGIPNWGPRALLQRRHTEWMNLWNANCDSKAPKPKSVLLRELDIWERTQGGNSSTPTDATSIVMRKDFDSAGWSASYDTDFKQLIANARKKSDAIVRSTIPNAAPVTPEEPQSAPTVDNPAEVSAPIVPTLAQDAPNGDIAATNSLDGVVKETDIQTISTSRNS
ncbi:E3 ubiquitin-protein ligase RAD18 [Aspergillus lucknowensis]|uniref:Postreplication repair E3 ubiquitin-protein ligase RAD18 n=1 Tax=Aspergillus lucknowensis TaxID=176173 RepID=A0ABR4LIW8_9EURO